CAYRFHCKCIKVIGDEYEYFMKTGSSTYKCKSCTKRNGSDEVSVIGGNRPSECDDAATASASSSCSACGCVNNLLQALHDKFDSLIKEVASVRADNVSLHLHLARNTELLRRFTAQAVLPPPTTTPLQVPSPEPASFASALGRDSRTDGGKVTPGSGRTTIHRSPSKTAVTLVSSALSVQVTGEVAPKDADGFTLLLRKKHVKPSSGTCASSKVSSVPRPPRLKARFVSRLSPDTSCDDVGAALTAFLEGKPLICIKLKTKHDSYSSFHITVNEEDFNKINVADVWAMGSLFRPFFGAVRGNDDRDTITTN
ncbi:unnamed protein product, partial [Ixodes pacificus]